MEKQIDVAAISKQDTIAIFNAVGIQTFYSVDMEEIEKKIFQLASNECKIIYVTEEIYSQIPETLEKYKSLPFPIIIPIPTSVGSSGVGMKKIKDNVEKAIGIDIF